MIKDPSDLEVLVNKKYRLPSDYVPENLVELDIRYSNEHKFLREEAKEAFEKLWNDAKKEGYTITVVSAYRDYQYQETLFASYVEEKGLEYAQSCCALPGHSEHQTGLAIDVMGSNNDYDEFENSIEFKWMKDHAHLYGFILRYPKEKVEITGFKYEPWHYRYVGIETATNIYQNHFTLEEYKKNE